MTIKPLALSSDHCLSSALAVSNSQQYNFFPLEKFGFAGNRTRAWVVGSANASAVLCRPIFYSSQMPPKVEIWLLIGVYLSSVPKLASEALEPIGVHHGNVKPTRWTINSTIPIIRALWDLLPKVLMVNLKQISLGQSTFTRVTKNWVWCLSDKTDRCLLFSTNLTQLFINLQKSIDLGPRVHLIRPAYV